MSKRFETGSVYVTNGVDARMNEDNDFANFVNESFYKHCNGDWGTLDEEDWAMNDRALAKGDDRIFSRYEFNGDAIYIITEWDRSVTTILFPDEY